MSIKTLVSTTILILTLGGCANSQTKVQGVIPKINTCVQKDTGFGVCPEPTPHGAAVWISHEIRW